MLEEMTNGKRQSRLQLDLPNTPSGSGFSERLEGSWLILPCVRSPSQTHDFRLPRERVNKREGV